MLDNQPAVVAGGSYGKCRKTPVKFELEANYYVEQPDAFGPDWMVGINITPVVPDFTERKSKGK